jgi:hypothetical protein
VERLAQFQPVCYNQHMHKKITDIHLDGFSMTYSKPGEQAKILMKGVATSDESMFYVYAEQIAKLIFPKLGVTQNDINRYLLIIHPDDTADAHLQDFDTTVNVQMTRAVKAGEPVFTNDIADISEARFPGVSITRGDRIVYFERRGWRFGILFDFTRKTDTDLFAKDAAQLQKKLLLEDILQITLAGLRDAEQNKTNYDAFIFTEGKTDKRHLQRALDELGYHRNLWYEESDKDRGDVELLEMCKHLALTPHAKPIVCIFDRDNEVIIKQLEAQTKSGASYQDWGNNVYSMMLPIPKHRAAYQNISIEMYYTDEVLGRRTKEGNRLCFDNELKTEILPGKVRKVVLIQPDQTRELSKKVQSNDIDRIEDTGGQKIGLSKAAFAELIRNKAEPFQSVDFEPFGLLADILESILQGAPKKR